MIGRDQPIQTLRGLFDQVQAGHTQIALISGEAGIGKSRLMHEFKAQLRSSELFILQGVCFEADQMLPYAPISDLLHSYFASASVESKKNAFADVTVELTKLLPELASEFPNLRSSSGEDEQERRRLHQVLVQFFIQLTMSQVLLVIIEDVHWCDNASFEFLLFLAQRLSEQRILLVMTYRDDETNSALARFLVQLNRERRAVELHLDRLTQETVGAILGTIFEEKFTSHRKFVESIHNLSEGNPFFIEELLKSLIAAGDIYVSDSQWKFKPLFELHTPRTIQINLNQRLSLLTPTARQILSLAAVAGRRFDFALLQHLSGLTESELLRIMRELREAQLVAEESADRFTFRHALTRQAVYDDLLLRERRNLHRIIGETLEYLYRDDPTQVGDIAYHYYQAEIWDKVYVYSQQAAERAQDLYSPSAALEYYTHAMDALERLGQSPSLELLRVRGQMYERTGNFEAARDDYTRMIAVAQAANNQIAEWQGWSDLGWLWTERDFARAGEYFAHALDLAHQLKATTLLVQTLNRVGNWHLHIDQLDQGLRYHQQALALADQLNDARGQAETLDLLGLTSYYLGEMSAGTDYYRRCIALFRNLGDLSGLSASLSVMSMRGASYNLDTFDCPEVSLSTCIQEGAEAVEAARKMGWRAGEASALLYCGFGLGPRGEWGQALHATHLGLAIAIEIEHSQWQGAAHMVLGAIYRDMLAFEEARNYHETVFKIVQDLHSPFLLRMVAGHLISTYVACNQINRAEDILKQVFNEDLPSVSIGQRLVWCAKAEFSLAVHQPKIALEIVEHLIKDNDFTHNMIPHLEHLKGEALRQSGQTAACEVVLVAADEVAQKHGMLPLRWRILISLGKCYQEQGRHDQADQAFSRAQETVAILADSIHDPKLRDNFLLNAHERINVFYHPSPRRIAKRAFDGLTAREREIAALIAEGKSNRAIADTLILSERTVAKHVENMLSKLSFTSRAQIAAWAVTKELFKT